MTNEQRLDNHEQRITRLEVSDAKLVEKIANLATSTDRLLKVSVIFGLILLGTVCYMALGEKGYKNVIGGPLLHATEASQAGGPLMNAAESSETISK